MLPGNNQDGKTDFALLPRFSRGGQMEGKAVPPGGHSITPPFRSAKRPFFCSFGASCRAQDRMVARWFL